MKIVINDDFGGFGVSTDVLIELVKRNAKCIKSMTLQEYYCGSTKKHIDWQENWQHDLEKYEQKEEFLAHNWDFNVYKDGLLYFIDKANETRTDKDLIEVIETLGEKSFGKHANLKVIEIPDNIEYEIHEYDGLESIHEKHRSWS